MQDAPRVPSPPALMAGGQAPRPHVGLDTWFSRSGTSWTRRVLVEKVPRISGQQQQSVGSLWAGLHQPRSQPHDPAPQGPQAGQGTIRPVSAPTCVQGPAAAPPGDDRSCPWCHRGGQTRVSGGHSMGQSGGQIGVTAGVRTGSQQGSEWGHSRVTEGVRVGSAGSQQVKVGSQQGHRGVQSGSAGSQQETEWGHSGVTAGSQRGSEWCQTAVPRTQPGRTASGFGSSTPRPPKTGTGRLHPLCCSGRGVEGDPFPP